MLQHARKALADLLAYDPGALRLVRGVHLMLTVLAAATLGNVIGGYVPGVSGFKLAVMAAASGAHCLIFTPVATRRQEITSIAAMGAILISLFSVGALVGTLAGASISIVLQVLWVGVIALGFSLDGLGGVWQRAGRMISICWLFVFMGSLPVSPGVWLPAMAIVGALTAFTIRICLWRPSTEATYRRVEAANRKVMAAFLKDASQGALSTRQSASDALKDLSDLRAELRTCAQLLGPKPALKGLSPEAATMIELALDVVRDATNQLSNEARAGLSRDAAYLGSVRAVSDKLQSGSASGTRELATDWAKPDPALASGEQFQILRIAQALRRLWLLAEEADLEPLAATLSAEGGRTAWWRRLAWRLALQAGVAAAAGTALGVALDLSHAYWVTLTVIIVLTNSLGTTLQKTVQRTVGTAVGVVIAMAVDPVLAGAPELRLGLVIAAIPAVIVFMDRNYTIASGIISFLVVMGLQTLEGLPLAELWARLYDTLLGAAIGLGAAWLLFPKRSGNSIRVLMDGYLVACANFLKCETHSEQEDRRDLARLRAAATQLIATADAYRAEQAPWSSFSGSGKKLDVLVIVLANYVVLYRQARTAVRRETEQSPTGAAELETLAGRLDDRVQDALSAVLKGRPQEAVPGLAEDWQEAVPELSGAGTRLATDWVAMLYHARKVIRCLEGLREDKLWSGAFERRSVPSSH
ncbi:FUSC family protein [Roseibium sediminicola]|uniref:FUSC family protein n=1 Tax=Roseibium sediminicola TaxID=2933272 RepID=A0ABT0GQU2_9HYPH|nr:FUSC family protein [Roseibium sp. CAU 1639]MCK7611595.1 FUSC family protein [Roseibium sp. CAU 1639]